ncbi:hypothetical protein ABZ642_45755 [Streptomyces sp. NPDC007157]|uniref:hypothetical protein n=1 Tax=Streptomyces sp. NPDC007157 TaxID=3154681 RepID=UPI00340B7EE0
MAGALIAAIAAIAGLWFQAVATYWSQETAKDQLQQSKEDGERQDREQALRVAYWVENEQPRVIHFINRSLDPVTNVTLIIEGTGARDTVYEFSEVRPCAEILLPETIMEADRKTTLRDWEWSIREIKFTDTNGRGWKRTSTSLVSDSRGPDWLHSIGENTKKAPQILNAHNCGDSEK